MRKIKVRFEKIRKFTNDLYSYSSIYMGQWVYISSLYALDIRKVRKLLVKSAKAQIIQKRESSELDRIRDKILQKTLISFRGPLPFFKEANTGYKKEHSNKKEVPITYITNPYSANHVFPAGNIPTKATIKGIRFSVESMHNMRTEAIVI